MRLTLLIIVIFFSFSLRAQSFAPYIGMNYSPRGLNADNYSMSDSNQLNKKWSLYKYAGISASYGFYNGGSASVLSAPIGLQLNRRLNQNLYAFAGISVAPAYVNFNHSFVNPDIHQMNPAFGRLNTNSFNMYSRFEAGLMYINNDKTFSISGSISIEHSSYPQYPSYYRTNIQKQQPVYMERQ